MIAAIVCCVLAAGQRISVRRRQLWFVATAFFGLFFVVVGVANYLHDRNPLLFEASGVIVAASVRSNGDTEIQVRMAGGGVAHINAAGQNEFFRVGEHVKAKYAAYSGRIQNAQFFAADGTPEGTFQTSDWKFPYGMTAFGFFAVGLGWLNYWRLQRRLLPVKLSEPDAPSSRAWSPGTAHSHPTPAPAPRFSPPLQSPPPPEPQPSPDCS